MTDPQPQAPEAVADMRDAVTQAVVAAMAAPMLQAQTAHGQIQLVVSH